MNHEPLPTLTIAERPHGVLLWDCHRLIATLSRNNALNEFVLNFNNGDPLGWGAQYLHSKDAANYLALAYAHELRATKDHHH